MSYITRINVKWWLKYTFDLKPSPLHCNSCFAASKSLYHRPGFTQTIPRRLLSTKLQPVLRANVKPKVVRKKSNVKFENNVKLTETVAQATEVSPVLSTIPKPQGEQKTAPRHIRPANREKMAKVKRDELDRRGRELGLNKSLLPYLELCVFNGELQRGLKTLNYYRAKKSHPQQSSITDMNVYNILLHGYAATGNLAKVKEIFHLALVDELKPTPQSYAAILECLGRAPHSANRLKNIRFTLQSLESSEFTLNDIFNHCTFERDQREVILATIQKIHPDFEPKINRPVQEYVCPLLEKLNADTSKATFVSPCEGLISSQELKNNVEKQFKYESTGKITIKSIEKKQDDIHSEHFRNVLNDTEKIWATAIKAALDRNLNTLVNTSQRHSNPWAFNLYPFLKVLDPEIYVDIINLEIRRLAEGSETYSPSVMVLYRDLGSRAMNKYQTLRKKEAGILEKLEKLYDEYLDWYIDPKSDLNALNTRQKWQNLLYDHQTGPHVDVMDKRWSNVVLCNIGRFLYGIIMRDIKIDAHATKVNSKISQIVPAFYSIFRMSGHYLKEEIKPHPALVKLFQAASRDELTFDALEVPMVCPPLPWASVRSGGYLLSTAKIVRLPFSAQQQLDRLENSPPENLYPALDSLNQLGCVPWKINEQVLDVVIEVFNNKGNDEIGIPPPPSECPAPPVIDAHMTKEETIAAHKQRNLLRRQKAEMYSLWCDALYKFSLANHFRKEIIWFPHNLDFRGRVYPCPPHLNHLGADAARSILVFAKGEPLGPNGLDWLKIHMINLTGLKKRDSIAERLRYANEIMDDVLDSAENPLTGRKWWMKSDEPWQTLATCMEIAKVIKSGDPAGFISNFPIHQDGSCNGLQHYAALGRDQAGAESVNLAPSEIPQDVYSAVASLVEKQRALDADLGMPIANALEGFIRRKVIKQTVMTTVYGVTRFGARLQIAKQLKDISDFPKEHVWAASLYLVNATFDSLQEMFTTTKEIQDWFTECAHHISQVCGQNVEWVTPLGLPVVQPYIKPSKTIANLVNPHRVTEDKLFDMFERPNVMKQKNAFPPNYIHSLDSSHMMLTSINCERKGITFVSVHDCYWTHPMSVDIMSQICREQFVALHSQPILEDLSDYLVKQYSYSESEFAGDGSLIDASKARLNRVLKQVPPKGKFNLNNVLKSVYFFS